MKNYPKHSSDIYRYIERLPWVKIRSVGAAPRARNLGPCAPCITKCQKLKSVRLEPVVGVQVADVRGKRQHVREQRQAAADEEEKQHVQHPDEPVVGGGGELEQLDEDRWLVL